MSKFDVFINGIQPDYISESMNVIEELSVKLKINSQIAEKIIKSPNTKIGQSVSKSQAEKLQLTLHEIGVISLYKPCKDESTGFTLEPIKIKEEDDDDDVLTVCPSCEKPFSGNHPPEKCSNCGVYIEKYLKILKDENEKEQIRQNLLRKDSIRTAHEKKIIDEKAAAIRKKILEQEILDEKSGDVEKNKIEKKTLILSGGCIIMVITACLLYLYSGQEESFPSNSVEISLGNSVEGETFQETEELETAIPVSISETVGSQVSQSTPESEGSQQIFQQTDDLATDIPVSSAGIQEISTGQNLQGSTGSQSPQQAYEQASQVLSAFGLDTKAFAKNTGHVNTTPGSILSSVAQTGKDKTELLQSQESSFNVEPLSVFLSNFGIDEHGWEHFLTQKSEQLIKNNSVLKANKIIQNVNRIENFIVLSGMLLDKSDHPELHAEVNLNIEERIQGSALDLQAQYYAKVAALHYHKNSGFLFNRAENSWKKISDYNKQLASAVKIATSFFEAGKTESANKYFNKINNLLSNITTIDNQISARIAISQAFQKVGQTQIALNWLKSTNKFISNSKKSSIREVIRSYAFLNQIITVQALIEQTPSDELKNELIFSAIVVFLDSGFYESATSLVDSIQTPNKKAVALTMLASYRDDSSSYLALAETLLHKNIKGAANKAIVSSRIAQQYARQNNRLKVSELFRLSEQLINQIPSSAEKDKVLEVVITNFSSPIVQKSVKSLSSSFQSDSMRFNMNESVGRLSEISSLLLE